MEETIEGGRGPPLAVVLLGRARERERERNGQECYEFLYMFVQNSVRLPIILMLSEWKHRRIYRPDATDSKAGVFLVLERPGFCKAMKLPDFRPLY